MTTAPPEDPDPTVDPLDERLSAALDGAPPPDTDAAAGRDPADARATDRARAIEAARDLLTVAPPPLDDLTRRRMLRAALAAAPAARDRARGLRVAGAAAAVLVVVAAGALALRTLDHSSSQSSSAAKAASGTTVVPGVPSTPVDLHEVSNPQVLKQRVQVALGETDAGSAAPSQARAPASTTAPAPHLGSSTAAGTGGPARCVSTVHVGNGVTPELLGTATYRGAPAIVVVALDHSRTLIYVLASSDCRLLSYQFLR